MYNLHPVQFGFKSVPKEEWTAAQDASDFNRDAVRKARRVSPNIEIHTGQNSINALGVQHYQENGARSHAGKDQPVELIRHKGKTYMGEGHHRLAAARENGNKRIRVQWTDTGEK